MEHTVRVKRPRLTLGDLVEFVEACGPNADPETPVRVNVYNPNSPIDPGDVTVEATFQQLVRPAVHRPHSKACGIRRHDHGPECAKDCPTCHPPDPLDGADNAIMRARRTGDCRRCATEAQQAAEAAGEPFYVTMWITQRMIVCPECGNKRCPKATDHRFDCTGSNEPNQPGSAYRYAVDGELPTEREQ